MLILSRRVNESIVIDGRIIVKIVRVDGEVVKVGIQAPSDVPVHRQEIYLEIQKNNQEALTSGRPAVPKLPKELDTSAQIHPSPVTVSPGPSPKQN
ncbi:MAG: carbon storage regulator CsrA [Verrucomicrobiota bacterium]|jgi:carbon storage regulator